MKKLIVLSVFWLPTVFQFTFAQHTFPASGSAGISTASPNASSVPDITSITKGMPAPRMTKSQCDAGGTCQREDEARLEQNVPNPFSENTVIGYYIPESAAKAWIKIYSPQGAELKSILITSRGAGDTTIAARMFAPGIYNYSLIVDDSVVETKKLVLTK